MTPARAVHIEGPVAGASVQCERILRTLPRWFGIESALRESVVDAERYPTFLAFDADPSAAAEPDAFLTARRHFDPSWEGHCIAVQASHRASGVGRALHRQVEAWVAAQGGQALQVKTLADSHPSPAYAQTRRFYTAVGYQPLEVSATLWGEHLPVLQLIKQLPMAESSTLLSPAAA